MNVKKYIGKSVYDLMMDVDSIECDILPQGRSYYSNESYPSLYDFGKKSLTPEGHKKWDSILKKYIIVDAVNIKQFEDIDFPPYPVFNVKNNDNDNDYLALGLKKFEECFAGYCSDADYEKWFKSGELKGHKIRIPKKNFKKFVKPPIRVDFRKML